MKELICAKDIESLINQGKKELCISQDAIITPSARDAASVHGVSFVSEISVSDGTDTGGIDSELIYKALLSIAGEGKLADLLGGIGGMKAPYLSEKDVSGVKFIRGSSVTWEALDTGNPSDAGKVYYRELMNQDDGSPMNAGFITIEQTDFAWDVVIHEIYYIIEGTLQVTINGKSYLAQAGDSVYFPKGARAAFGSPDKMKAFYVTY